MKPQYPLVFSTLLGRVGVGIVVVHIFMSLASKSGLTDWHVVAFSIVCIGLSVLISMLHLGKPQRFLNAFSNPKSMLTWEAFVMPPLFGSMAVFAAGSYFGNIAWLIAVGKIGTVIFGLMLIFITAKVYHLKARPAWSTSLVVYEFFLSTTCIGALGYISIVVVFGKMIGSGLFYLSGLAMIVLVAEFVVTLYYRHYTKAASQAASEVLGDVSSISQYYLWIALGLAVPFVLCAITLFGEKMIGAMAVAGFLSFFLGAMFFRILFFKTATPIKITPDIADG